MLHKLAERDQGQFFGGENARRRLGTIGLAVAIGIAYFLTARLGRALLTNSEHLAVFWLGSGLAAGILIGFGRGTRTAVVAGVIGASVANNLMAGTSIWSAVAFALCNAGEAVLAAWLIERWSGPAYSLDRLRHALALFVVAGVATAVAAAGATVAMILFGPSTAPLFSIWRVWFSADALGMITVAPLLIGVAAATREIPSLRELLEGTLAVISVTAAYGLALALLAGPWSLMTPGLFLFPLLLWLCSRCRPVFAAAAVFTVALAIVWTTTHELGRFGDPSQAIADRVLAAQITMLGATLTALALAALFAERRRNEARLLSILDAANVIAWDADLSRDAVRHIGPIARFSDKPGGLQIKDSATFAANIFPDDRDRVLVELRTAIRRRACFCTEFRVPLSDSGVRWVAVEGTTERDKDGRAVSMLGVTRDITERKKAELALAERTMQLALAGKAALVGSFAYDLDTERMQISEGYAAIYGFPDGTTEIARNEWQLGLHPEDLIRLEEIRSRCFRERLNEYRADYRIVRSQGDVRWLDARCFVSYHGDGRPKRVVGVNIDVTERKQAEEHYRAMNAELDHRVKNVLATVIAIITRTQEASSSLAGFVAGLDNRIRSMAMTHELLSHSNWRGVPLAEMVRREFAPYAAGNAEIGGPSVTLRAEATQAVSMVLHELTTNAAKHGAFTNRSGRVLLRWWWLQNGTHGPLAIEWQEIGGPPVREPSQSGYGTSIIRELIPYELGGKVDLAFASDGLRCRLDIPANWTAEAAS